MAAYLEEHPPARSQYRKGRRAKPTGTIVLHTAENTPDLAGADSGAENIARFISQRTDAPGSYHLIGDRDSQIELVPFEWEAFHDGTGSNPWSVGISLAITAAWFRNATNEEKLWYMARLATMARTASDWLEANHGITVPARRLTKASQREAGFCTHMDRENWEGTPGRRSDPWGNSDEMWHLFLTLYDDTAHQEDEPLKLDDEDRQWFRDLITEAAGPKENVADWKNSYGQEGVRRSIVRWCGEIVTAVRKLKADEIGKAVAQALSGAGTGSLTLDDIEAAAKKGTEAAMREAFD